VIVIIIYLVPVFASPVRNSIFIQSVILGLQDVRWSRVVAVNSGAKVVSGLQVILHLPYAPHVDRGRPRQ
jgi:hypothetical protein